MKYNFDEPINRKETYSVKYDIGNLLIAAGLTERFDNDTIPLFLADMDFTSPKPVLDALHNIIDSHKMFGYSTHLSVPDYNDAIIHWFKSKRDWDIKREEILYINGTVEAIKQTILAFSNEGEGVIIQPPVYTPFFAMIRRTNRKIVTNPLINNNGYYTLDFDDLEAKAKDPNNKVLILCNPHNPVGRVWKREELTQLSEICLKNNITIVADEIHGDILRKGQKFHPIATVTDNKNLVSLTAVNKTFNLAGLHCTNAVIKDKALRSTLSSSMGAISPTPFAIAALIAAYNEGDEWLEQVNDYIDGNIDWVLGFLKEKMPKVKCFRPEGTYIMWMDFREYGLTAEEIRKKIYVDANVMLESGPQFDPENGAGFERACLPSRRAVVQEAFFRIHREFEG